MSGAFVTINLLGLEAIQGRLARLAMFSADRLRPLLADIGEIVVDSVQRNFEEHRSPEGEPWQPLAESTKAIKESKGKKAEDVLIFSSHLLHSIHREVHPETGTVNVGTDRIYGAVHQFGIGERSGITSRRRMPAIPARPFLGLRSEDHDSINDAINDRLEELLR